MTADLDEWVKQQQRSTASGTNDVLVIDGGDAIWKVESGSIDVFWVITESDKPSGSRRHLFRVTAGQAIFSMNEKIDGANLIGVPTPNTILSGLYQGDAKAGVYDQSTFNLSVLLDGWVTALGDATANQEMPLGRSVHLEPNNKYEVPNPTRVLFSVVGVTWVRHTKGASFFLRKMNLPPIMGSLVFPITRVAWLQSSPGTELETYTASGFTLEDPEWQGLALFHSLTASVLGEMLARAIEKDAGNRQARRSSDNKRFSDSLNQLVGVVQGDRFCAPELQPATHPIFLACGAVGKRLGIHFRPHPDMLKGHDVPDPVYAIANASEVRSRKIVLKGLWHKESLGPLLGFRGESKTPVALLPRTFGGYDAFDPSTNTTVRVTAAVGAEIDPFCYMFYRPLPATNLSGFQVFRFGLFGCSRELLTILATGVAVGALGMVVPIATQIIVDQLIPQSRRGELVEMIAFMLVVITASAMFTYVRGFAVLRLQGKIDAAIQSATWDRILSLPTSFFREYSSGDLAQRSLGVTLIREALTGSTLAAALTAIFSLFNFGLLFYYSIPLAVVATVLVVIAFLVSLICGFLQLKLQRRSFEITGVISSLLLQFIEGIAKFRVSGTESRAFSIWAHRFATKKAFSLRIRHINGALITFNAAFPIFSLGCIFVAYLRFSAPTGTSLTIGAFLAFLAAFSQFLAGALVFSTAVTSALTVVPLYERILPIFKAVPEVTENKASPGAITGKIDINHLSFRYKEDSPLVLTDVSLSIQPGQFIALVGASGCGKSTLFRLLLGFEQPDSGAIYLDGQDLSGLNIRQVRSQIGVVLQSSRPANGTIFENIVGSRSLTTEEAMEAARLAGLESDLAKLPMGLHTYLSDGGGGISGGQRQRVMIARAIAGRPKLLLFDEATSALDNNTQSIVSESLEQLQATRIVIAHRLSTIVNADKIFVFDRGQIVESGSYRELTSKAGLFSSLASRQLL
jgi:NHLM bacteriocin system ABC transporter ATP-binding protein